MLRPAVGRQFEAIGEAMPQLARIEADGPYAFSCCAGCELTANGACLAVMSTADAGGNRLHSWKGAMSGAETVTPSTAAGWHLADDGPWDTGGGRGALARADAGMMSLAAGQK